jgi:hypothetical protein
MEWWKRLLFRLWLKESTRWLKGTAVGICIAATEVKFLDRRKTNYSESICQECFHWSRTKVWGSKAIRYRPSSNHKRCQLAIRLSCLFDSAGSSEKSSKVPGEVWLQSWNLKELTEGHHQKWSLRLNLTQHGETHSARTLKGLTDWELFLDSVDGGAWPFLVGGAICLVNSDNERGSSLLNRRDVHCTSRVPS